MMTSNHTWIDGEEYWIRYHMGTHEVRRETPDGCPDNETFFTGSYEKCYQFLQERKRQYEESLY